MCQGYSGIYPRHQFKTQASWLFLKNICPINVGKMQVFLAFQAFLGTMDEETRCPMGYRQAYSTGGITHI